MRGLVVLVVAAGMLLLLLSTLGSAQSNPDVKPAVPTINATCTAGNGTTIVLKANEDIRDLKIGSYCSHDLVPAGWSVVCKTDKSLSTVEVRYTHDGDERRTLLTCS